MNSAYTAFVVGTSLIVGLLLLVAVVPALVPVSRFRVETFLDRTGTTLTRDNAPLVLDGLARSRRWRTAGVTVGAGLWLALGIVLGSISLTTFTGVVVGVAYTLGAVAGELRSTWARPAGPRTASLQPRQLLDYAPPWVRLLPAVLTSAAVLLSVVLTIRVGPQALLLLASAVVPWIAGAWCARVVVERPMPVATQDVVDADAGLRSRALHAVGGAVSLVAGWVVIALVTLLLAGDDLPQTDSGLALLAMAAMLGWLGFCIAIGSRPFSVVSRAVVGADKSTTEPVTESATDTTP